MQPVFYESDALTRNAAVHMFVSLVSCVIYVVGCRVVNIRAAHLACR